MEIVCHSFSTHQKKLWQIPDPDLHVGEIKLYATDKSILAENTDFELSILSRYEFSVTCESNREFVILYTIHICAVFVDRSLSQSRNRWGKPISVRFSRFNFGNAWAYSWKQRWVFHCRARVEKFAVSDSESSGISNFYRAVIGARGCFSIGRISPIFLFCRSS